MATSSERLAFSTSSERKDSGSALMRSTAWSQAALQSLISWSPPSAFTKSARATMMDCERFLPVVSSAITVQPLAWPRASRDAGTAAAATLPEAMVSKRTGSFCSSSVTIWSSGTPASSIRLSMTYSRMVLEPTPMGTPARSFRLA